MANLEIIYKEVQQILDKAKDIRADFLPLSDKYIDTLKVVVFEIRASVECIEMLSSMNGVTFHTNNEGQNNLELLPTDAAEKDLPDLKIIVMEHVTSDNIINS